MLPILPTLHVMLCMIGVLRNPLIIIIESFKNLFTILWFKIVFHFLVFHWKSLYPLSKGSEQKTTTILAPRKVIPTYNNCSQQLNYKLKKKREKENVNNSQLTLPFFIRYYLYIKEILYYSYIYIFCFDFVAKIQ